MKKIFALILAFMFVLSSCAPSGTPSKTSNPKKASSEGLQHENKPDSENIYTNKISENRKAVYDMLKNCDDILDTVPNPSENMAVAAGSVYVPGGEALPACIIDWAYGYFNYIVTLNVPKQFDKVSEEGRLLRFLSALRRIDGKTADRIEISAQIFAEDKGSDNTVMTLTVLLNCNPLKYNKDTDKYFVIPNSSESICVTFNLEKKNGKWVIESNEILYGSLIDYAKTCINKTQGRFPEIDKYKIVDFAICEYSERLYDFGSVPWTN